MLDLTKATSIPARRQKTQGLLDLFFEAAPHLEYFFQVLELSTKAAFAKVLAWPPLPAEPRGEKKKTFFRRESSGGMERLGVWNCIFSGSEISNFGA